MATAVLVALGALSLALLYLAVRQGARPAARKALAQVDRHALDVAVNNASVLSSFTRVVAGARTQSAVLGSLREHVQALERSVDTVAEAAATTCGEVDSMHVLTLRGDALLQETLQRIASLEQSAGGLEARFREVRQHTGNIEGIVAMIQNVAMQTHLLSLNAAVEAARAGEKGAGFAVVADEVRMLAQSTQKTARDIRGLVGTSRGQAGAGVAEAEALRNILGGLAGHLENLSNETDMIAGALDEGSGAISRLGTQITSLEDEASRALTLPARRQQRAVNGG